jgi:excisionase family DNA binding protein
MTNVSVSNLLTVKEVAAEFGVHHNTVRNWVNSGQITAYRIGSRLLRFKREDVLAITTLCVENEPKIGSSQWLDDDTFETTFGTLKRSILEAGEAERERLVGLLEAALVVWRGVDPDLVRGGEACLALIKGEQS